ncbi:hypothetical protein [Pseudomonas pseudonitroreducens]|uniref:hypothetical protein n=1 Tax=Pseudomonas pseudonitroreducens TaxID=2892326 RepID=UPI001F35A9BB|nr:hypothetical protein [Pseudomonas pseudonitroreducens]
MNVHLNQQKVDRVEIVAAQATILGWQMSQMNFAREEFSRLEQLLRSVVMPALGSYENPICRDLDMHLEQVRTFSGNFCWKSRDVGAAHDAKDVSSPRAHLIGRLV